ncbi:MAG: NAD-dependent epimerase/dehydratase family protein [SAR324 cluster bacterium]|nr:NAD-dependent epimerase/dehydratase family protein [SAR324 cluster bacterium]MBF0352368.1 NAD-dependent epimerase/dehydratase family protein [SAR324 cluster bacterium]
MAQQNKPQILITGAGGELAHRVAEKLKKNYDLIGVDFRDDSHYDDELVKYRLDFSKRGFEEVFRHHEFEGILHLGRLRMTQKDRFKRYNVNVLGTQRLLELGRKYGVNHSLVLSTYHVYGAHPYNPSLIDESFPMKAANWSSELVDGVELENLVAINMLRHRRSRVTILRPCNVIGPGVKNQISGLLSQKKAPVISGYAPLMQFIHVEDLAEAIAKAYSTNHPGIYNVATEDWIPYTRALELAGCETFSIPSVPPLLTRRICSVMKIKNLPPHMVNYFKYPIILESSLFNKTFHFEPKYTLDEMFGYYRGLKSNQKD